MNIGSLLTQAARSSPDHIAIVYGDLRRTYRDFDARGNMT
jgi:non-ribosomal peptide synthetase component F